MNKVLLHFAARDNSKEALCKNLDALAKNCADTFSELRSTVMRAHDEDKMKGTGDMQPLPYAFDASIELLGDKALPIKEIAELLLAEMPSIEPLIHPDLSAVQLGTNKVFVESKPTPIRFQYCMRRRADHTEADYLHYYKNTHAKFGIGMRGIEGYAQFHIDVSASEQLASQLTYGVCGVNSVSELHIADMETFYTGMAKGIDAGNPGEDEDRFVDRRRSIMWLSDETARYPGKAV